MPLMNVTVLLSHLLKKYSSLKVTHAVFLWPQAPHLWYLPWPDSGRWMSIWGAGWLSRACRVWANFLPILSANLGRLGGVGPGTVRDMIQDGYWLWGPVTEGIAGASLLPRDPEKLADLQGGDHPG